MHADEPLTLGPLSVTVRDNLVKRKWDVYSARSWPFPFSTVLDYTGRDERTYYACFAVPVHFYWQVFS